jgi:hypothetical protein
MSQQRKKLLKSFLKRYTEIIYVKLPKGISATRVESFSKENMEKFLYLLELELKKTHLNPDRL